jgi:hypothetical protein
LNQLHADREGRGGSLSDHLGTREIQHFIDGRYTASLTRQTFAKRFSLNYLPIGGVAEGGADVDVAVTGARSALHGEYCAHRAAANVNVGITWVNGRFLRDSRTPFCVARQSGIGREGGVTGVLLPNARCVYQALRA